MRPSPSQLRLASLGLFGVLGVFMVAFGALYASVQSMLPFHAAAVPAHALGDVRPLYFALMKLIGGASAGLGLLGLYVTFGPLRRGAPGAATALFATYAVPIVMAAIVAEHLAAATGAPTSWHIMGVLMAINAAALGAHALARRTGHPSLLAPS
ncbi:MAG: hypothetical protein JNJ73_09015 [Hyphomonadaceae bacterium]|nr:hypothetical protein [Hyphomonadaceae bacterium]